MKKLNIFFGFLLIFTTNLYSQNENETIDFLNSKFAIYTAPMVYDPSYIVVKTKIENRSQRKIIIIETFINQKLFSTTKFHPEHINGVITFRPENGNLCIKIISNKGLILNQFYGDDKETFQTEARIVLLTSDEEVYRIKKAFEHLLKLNGVKQANDNLFRN
jgi:hypothetical protein